MHFKNTDVRWGAGEGTLPSLSVDENFYETGTRLTALETSPPIAISVDHVSFDDTTNTITVVLTDGYSFGPFPLPTAQFTMLGEWTPLTLYPTNVFISEGGSTYLVQFPHTSAATFDPGANDGLGHNYYALLPFPTAPIIEFLDDGWQPLTAMGAFKLFSIADDGVYLSLFAHTTEATFDPTLVDGLNRPIYQKVFAAIETAIARIQFQFPGTPPSDASCVLVYVQDDDRDLVFAENWPGSIAHLNELCTDVVEWSIVHASVEIGRVTFSPGELIDGEGGQYGVITGSGTTIANVELLKVFAPGYADATAKFFTLSLVGTYQDPS
jgi:hypothetical protein